MARRWINGSRAMVTVNSISAGFSGALLVATLRVDFDHSVHYFAPLLAMLALFAFVFAAERVTDALDEGNVATYVWSMQIHNLGIVAIMSSLTMYLWLSNLPCPIYLAPALVALYWGYHFIWLLSKKNREEHIALISQPED